MSQQHIYNQKIYKLQLQGISDVVVNKMAKRKIEISLSVVTM